jgi:transcriptional regulator with XRE-family HTH domain
MKRGSLSGAVESLLRKNNWSQNDAAKHYGVTQSTVFRWLQGTVDPRPNALRQMVFDAGEDKALRSIFEARLGKGLAQVLREQAQTFKVAEGNLSKSVLENPTDHVDQIFVALYHSIVKAHRDAIWGDGGSAEKLRDAYRALAK